MTSDVPPYAIVGGVPAKLIRYRFNPPVISYLLTLDYSKLTEKMIREHIEELYEDIEEDSVEKMFAWFPKKGTERYRKAEIEKGTW